MRSTRSGRRSAAQLLLDTMAAWVLLLLACRFSLPVSQIAIPITIDGRVVSVSDMPVAGITIRVAQTQASARSGADGTFRLEDLPRGDLDLWIEASSQSSLTLNSLENTQANQLLIRLDKSGDTANVRVNQDNGVCVTNRMVRPSAAPDTKARGTIQVEVDGTYNELAISLERMQSGGSFFVLMQQDANSSASMTRIGTITTLRADDAGGFGGALAFVGDGLTGSTALPFGLPVQELQDRRVEVRGQRDGKLYLRGSVPRLDAPDADQSQTARGTLTAPGGADVPAGSVRAKSTPGGERDQLWVQIKQLDPLTPYEVCFLCGMSIDAIHALLTTAGPPKPTLSVPHLAAAAGDEITVPVRLDTQGLAVAWVQFVLEYDPAALALLSDVQIGTDAAAAGFRLTVNPTLPFEPMTTGFANILIQLVPAEGIGALTGGAQVAIMHFKVSASASRQSTPLDFDDCAADCLPAGRLHSFVGTVAGATLAADELAFSDGSITIAVPECHPLMTSEEGEAHLLRKVKQCEPLPCGAAAVTELGGTLIQVRDAAHNVILVGEVPRISPP